MSLTQEYLDSKFSAIDSKFSSIEQKMDVQTKELKDFTTKAIDDLARDVLRPSFQQLEHRLDIIEDILVEDRLPVVEKEFHKLQNYKEAIKQARQS